ncbi:MAG: hypothetical protein NC923_03780 [Candidatus Omnitrophica bacterium]|nr:hypothetical protein [Candidatus Omnitrophota bacterium]
MEKKKWQRAKLTVLVRGGQAERVLGKCQYTPHNGDVSVCELSDGIPLIKMQAPHKNFA